MTLTSSLRLGVSFSFGPWTLSTPQCGGVGPPLERVSDFSFRAFALPVHVCRHAHHSALISQRRERVKPLLVVAFLLVYCLLNI
jgi:hypothetical protein